MIVKAEETKKVELLLEGWQETLIWSCLQNMMGEIYADSLETPASAMAHLGDFCFLAGKPNRELVLYRPERCRQDFIIMVPQNELWAEEIERCYGGRAKRVTRYAIQKEKGIFDRNKLQNAVRSLPPEYSLKMIDENCYHLCREQSWSADLVSQYPDYGTYERLGIGAVILKDGGVVSGASSYSRYRDGIEIEIDTKEAYRRKGLAYICASKLILECLERNLYPSWDAQNQWSVALAEKLGYHYDHAYPAYEVRDWGK